MSIANKLLWDIPLRERKEIAGELEKKPSQALQKNLTLFVRALNTLNWYELIDVFGVQKLCDMLTDDVIDKIFPAERREYYKHARRLLSSYALSPTG
jgi:hypothetical protein